MSLDSGPKYLKWTTTCLWFDYELNVTLAHKCIMCIENACPEKLANEMPNHAAAQPHKLWRQI